MNPPLKYFIWGLVGGLLAILIMRLVGQQPDSPVAIVIGCGLGGLCGWYLKEKRKKKD